MTGPRFASLLLAALAGAAAAPAQPPGEQAGETVEAAIDRIFSPASELHTTLRRPVERHATTVRFFMALGAEQGCVVYRRVWRGAFDRHLAAWTTIYGAAVRSSVPEDILLREPGRFMDPGVLDDYREPVMAALDAAGANELVRVAAQEIVTELTAAATAQAAGAAVPPGRAAEVDALFAEGIPCALTTDYLEGRTDALGS